ncbi:unnamed protein product [Diplocarpon coronariae]|uniref:Uncharacterized protein n=1 Tax=Diplocarpon coronariae TaxID=2795749 RepID=A0A218Z9Y5_9HELO|nr:hypothetical protein B2J93_4203 [Marssonina coronariae]
MNRFRTKKRGKEAPDGLVRASTDSDGPPPTIKPSKTFRLGKKSQEPEPKPEIDLSTALPASDDFRTSLLMSGLSARFSMLREQDDPKSKIGKASDDSVLFPKRLSRLNELGLSTQGLSDIAEVSSINGSIRPPFATSRTGSYVGLEGYGTDDDSTHGGMMNRSKPGEGNNLFGGRQKIMMGNRALYESDVSQSAFQKIREREREEQRDQERQRQDLEAQSSRPNSPQLPGYNRKRETSSTTSSGGPSITRGSTPATSFTSQRTPSLNGGHTPVTPVISGNGALQRSTTKTRRLYETGLDNHLCEQQFSAMNRIDTLTRQRTLDTYTPPPGFSPTYELTPADRWDRQIAGKQSMPNLRAVSPPHTGPPLGSYDFGVRKNSKADSEPYGMGTPPLSPPMTEHDEHRAPLVPSDDRGMPSVMSGFSKPAIYDDDKYSQRQVLMKQGRETAPVNKNSPTRVFAPRNQQQQMGGRTRAGSNSTYASDRSRSNSSAQRVFPSHDRTTQAPMNKIFIPESHLAPLATPSRSPDDLVPEQPGLRNHLRPLDLSQSLQQDRLARLGRPGDFQHPANRPPMALSPDAPSPALSNSTSQPVPEISSQDVADSPTLSPGKGLSGLVRSHLRSDSNVSSVDGGGPSDCVSRFPTRSEKPVLQHENSAERKPWDNEGFDHESNFGHYNSENPMNGRAPPLLPFSVRSPEFDAPGKAPWEKEAERRHTRSESSETQKERQEFQNELASRRRKVQEKMQSLVENDIRPTSPLPPHPVDWPKDAYQVKNNALGLLKSKTSRGSLVNRPKEAGLSKAKTLGIGNGNLTSRLPSPAKSQFVDSSWNQEEEDSVRGPEDGALIEARRAAQRDMERQLAMRHQQRLAPEKDQDWFVHRKERERPRIANQRMDDSWFDNSRFQNSRMGNSRIDNRIENHKDHRLEVSRMNHQFRNRDQGERIPIHMKPPHRTPSRDRKPPPVAYSHRNGGNGQESRNSSGTSHTASRPPSNAPSIASRDRSESDTSGGRSKSRTGTYRDDLVDAIAEGLSINTQAGYEERELHPPPQNIVPQMPGANATGLPASPSPILSPMTGSNRSRSSSKSSPAGYFQKFPPAEVTDVCPLPRPTPSAPFVVNATPALVQSLPAVTGATIPSSQQGHQPPTGPSMRKKSINKSDISEPMFISSTSSMTTVDLPPGQNFQSGHEINAPPIPPVNPKRRQTRTMFGGIIGRRDDDEIHHMPSATQSTEEISTFSADEGDPKPRTRQRLRKSSSEAGPLNSRARQSANAAPIPVMPITFLPGSGSPPGQIEGGMF